MAPGQDYYHRILDGELYLFSSGERLCMACAERRGLLNDAPKRLVREGLPRGLPGLVDPAEYDLAEISDPNER
jgi:hypothetical protein